MVNLKFLKGQYENLAGKAIVEGQVLVCENTGEMFVDIASDKRIKIGDFITVANIEALRAIDATQVPTSRLYYVEDGNILARSNGTNWVQVNAQKTKEEMIEFLGLGALAYKATVAEEDLDSTLKEKINTTAAGNHTHANKAELDKIADGDVAKWNNKVDKVDGKSLILDTEIARLAGMSDGANKVEASTNGKIKIDGVDTTVYTHPEKHTIAEVDGLQDALDGKQAAGNYSVEGHKHVKADITDFAHTHIASEITDLDATIKAYDYATKTELGTAVQGAKDYAKDLVDAIPAQTDYTVTITENTDDENVAKTYVFTQNNKEIGTIKLAKELVVTSGAVKEVTEADVPYAGAKVEDKYIELVIANQDAPIYVPAKDLVDIYTAKDGAAEVQVAISNTNEISATLVNGGVTEEKLAEGVKTKLNKTWEEVGVAQGLVDGLANGQVKTNKEAIDAINNADTGILKQAKDYADGLADNYAAADHDHVAADITDFATEVAKVKVDEAVKATQDGNGKVIADTYAEKATTLAGYGITDAYTKEEISNQDAVVLSEAQKYADQVETDAVAAAKAETEGQIEAFAKTVYTKEEVEALFTWGTF